jgi:hypothetical protein
VKFEKKVPCNDCPFRRGTPMSLTPERVMEIGSMMLSSSGGMFPCHKTTISVEDEEDGSVSREAVRDSQHCAGALIFAEKNETSTQLMRIAERIGFYDAKALMADKKVVDTVFDSLREMREHLTRYERAAVKAAKKKKNEKTKIQTHH